MRTPKDIVLISTPQKYNNQIEIAGGQVIWIDTSFKPEHHVSISGYVEALPIMLSPNHYWHPKSTMDLEEGDKVYFNYMTIHPDNLIWYNDKEYYQVEYAQIFCYVRDGEMQMTNEWCFVEPLDMDKGSHYGNSDLIIPEAYRKEPNYQVGKLTHIGKPLKGEAALECKPGDYVIYMKGANFATEVEGEIRYTIKQKHLYAIIPQECLENFA